MSGVASWKAKIELDIEDLRKQLLNAENSIDQVTKEDRKIKLDLDTKTLESVIRKLDTMLDSIGKGTNNFKQFENLSAQLSSVTKDISNIGKAFSSMNDGTELVNNIKSINTSLTTLSNHFVSEVSGRMSTSIKDIKSTLSDVGDGNELTPLLQIINNIESAINELSSSVKGIGLNMNIDFGSDTEMESKAQAKISNALQAYQRLFDHIKMSGVGGQIITDKFFDFDINQYDTSMSKLQAYIKFIENMRNEAKQMFNGQDVLKSDTDKKYWTQASSAMSQVTKTFNEMKAASDTNPLENIFGKTELTEVIAQLGSIAGKLDDISNSAKNFVNAFNGGLDVTASVQEVTDLTNRVKELEVELVKIKSTSASTPQVASNILNENPIAQMILQAQYLDKTLNQVDIPTDSFDNVLQKLDRTKSELVDIVKITRQSFADADGKFHDSYTLKDSRGSTEIYGISSKTEKGQILRQNIVGYDVKKDSVNQSKEELEVQKQITAEIEAQSKANQKKYQEFQREEQAYQKEQNQIAYDKLTETIRQYSEVAKRVSSGKAEDGDLQKMTQLEEKISQLQKQPILSESQVAKSESSLNSLYDQLDKIEKKLQETNQQKVGNGLEKLSTYRGKSDKYSDTLKKFNDGGWASDEYIKNVNTVSEALKTYQAALQDVGTHELITSKDIDLLDKYESELKQAISAVQNMTAAQKGYDQLAGEKELNKISQILRENSNMSEKAKAEIRDYYNQIKSGNPSASLGVIHGKILDIVNAEEQAGRAGKSLWDIFKTSRLHQMVAQVAGMFSFYDAINGVKRGVSTVKELNTALTEMRKVSDESLQSLKNYQKQSFDTGDAIATTGLQLQNSIADWQRLGYSISEANELAKNSNIYKNVGDMDISTATEHMVSSVQAWKSEFNDDAVKTSEEVMNRYNKIGNEFAISSADIGEAMETSAAALKAGGNDLNEALGIITAGNIIQQDASTTSSAMKILSLRIRGAKSDLESMGESTDDLADSTSKLREEIKGLTGVDIMADEDTFKSTAEIIKEIGAVWDQMTDVSQAATLEKLAGKNRASTVAGLIENYKTIDKVIEAASNADNSALEENQKIIDSIDGKIQKLQNRVQEFWYNAIDDSTVKTTVSILTFLVETGTKLVDIFGVMPPIFASIFAFIGKDKSQQRFCPSW
jgi:TP901 family phage tail tape measure protein